MKWTAKVTRGSAPPRPMTADVTLGGHAKALDQYADISLAALEETAIEYIQAIHALRVAGVPDHATVRLMGPPDRRDRTRIDALWARWDEPVEESLGGRS